MSAFQKLRLNSRSGGIPGTIGIIGGLAFVFLLAWAGMRATMGAALAFTTADASSHPWTVLTYPFASIGDGRDLFFFLLLLLWLYYMGGSLEREMGTGRFLACWTIFTLLGAGTIALGAALAKVSFILMGAALPISAVTMLWGARFPEANIMLMLVIPFKGKWLAVLTAALVLFGYGTGAPLIGVCALIGPGLAWLYGANKIPFLPYQTGVVSGQRLSRTERQQEQKKHTEYMDAIKAKEKERAEKERLRQLFERSLIDDPDDKK